MNFHDGIPDFEEHGGLVQKLQDFFAGRRLEAPLQDTWG